VKRAVTPVNKGLLGVSFVRFFMPFFELDFKQNKHEITTILINEVMSKKKEKKDYEQPKCTVHEMETETFICTSVYPNAPQTTEADWEDGGEVDGGTIEF